MTTQPANRLIPTIFADTAGPQAAAAPVAWPHQIVVACAPKSGSTFVARVLERYFGIALGNRDIEIDWSAEQNLTPDVERQVSGRPFVLQLHLLPREINLNALTRLRARTVFTWRNLGDVIISYDDHVRNDGHRFPTFYIHDRGRFLAMPDQDRYQFLIQNALPWYFAFYLGWRERGVVLRPYEAMVAEPLLAFAAMIEDITRAPADLARLETILAAPCEGARLNVGVTGRSNELFSSETKRVLEHTVESHPERERLAVLLREVPWTPPALARDSEYDGRLLRSVGTDPVYFIDRGCKHYIASPNWVLSRWPGRAIEDVEAAILETFPMGAALP